MSLVDLMATVPHPHPHPVHPTMTSVHAGVSTSAPPVLTPADHSPISHAGGSIASSTASIPPVESVHQQTNNVSKSGISSTAHASAGGQVSLSTTVSPERTILNALEKLRNSPAGAKTNSGQLQWHQILFRLLSEHQRIAPTPAPELLTHSDPVLELQTHVTPIQMQSTGSSNSVVKSDISHASLPAGQSTNAISSPATVVQGQSTIVQNIQNAEATGNPTLSFSARNIPLEMQHHSTVASSPSASSVSSSINHLVSGPSHNAPTPTVHQHQPMHSTTPPRQHSGSSLTTHSVSTSQSMSHFPTAPINGAQLSASQPLEMAAPTQTGNAAGLMTAPEVSNHQPQHPSTSVIQQTTINAPVTLSTPLETSVVQTSADMATNVHHGSTSGNVVTEPANTNISAAHFTSSAGPAVNARIAQHGAGSGFMHQSKPAGASNISSIAQPVAGSVTQSTAINNIIVQASSSASSASQPTSSPSALSNKKVSSGASSVNQAPSKVSVPLNQPSASVTQPSAVGAINSQPVTTRGLSNIATLVETSAVQSVASAASIAPGATLTPELVPAAAAHLTPAAASSADLTSAATAHPALAAAHPTPIEVAHSALTAVSQSTPVTEAHHMLGAVTPSTPTEVSNAHSISPAASSFHVPQATMPTSHHVTAEASQHSSAPASVNLTSTAASINLTSAAAMSTAHPVLASFADLSPAVVAPAHAPLAPDVHLALVEAGPPAVPVAHSTLATADLPAPSTAAHPTQAAVSAAHSNSATASVSHTIPTLAASAHPAPAAASAVNPDQVHPAISVNTSVSQILQPFNRTTSASTSGGSLGRLLLTSQTGSASTTGSSAPTLPKRLLGAGAVSNGISTSHRATAVHPHRSFGALVVEGARTAGPQPTPLKILHNCGVKGLSFVITI